MTNECEVCGMDCGEEYICETCLEELNEPSEMDEWYDYDPDC